MNNFIIITARSNSTRLKNKILAKITPKYRSIDILIARASKIGLRIILATSNHKSDNDLVKYVKKKYSIDVFRGSLHNKLKRWHGCFLKYKIDYACMIDGDDLAFDHDMYKKNIFSKSLKKYNLVMYCKGIVTGSFTYILSKEVIKKLSNQTKKIRYLDVLDGILKNNKFKIKKINILKKFKKHKIRLTLDYKLDLIFFKELFKFKSIYESTNNLIFFLLKKKSISDINYSLEDAWKKNQIKQIIQNEK